MLASSGCTAPAGGGRDAASDGALVDASHVDASTDAEHDDADVDLGLDLDLGADVATPEDLGVDVGADLGADVSMPEDVGLDVGADLGADVAMPEDVGVDVGADLGVDAGDVDECALGLDQCDPNAECTNTIGGYTCTCGPCSSGDGFVCVVLDDCCSTVDVCDSNATCVNSPGGFSCACGSGYVGDGITCTDLNECLDSSSVCDANALCTNTEGSYICQCLPGYVGNGVTCTPEPTYAIGGSVLGLVGTGLRLRLDVNGEVIPVSTSGTFAFAGRLPAGTTYTVSVEDSPTDFVQSCSVSAGATGTVAGADVSSVRVVCGAVREIHLSVALSGTGRDIADGTASTCDGATSPTPGLRSSIDIVANHFVVGRVVVRLQGLSHPWAGDLAARLSHTDTATTRTVTFLERLGADASTACGAGADFAGDYAFEDAFSATPWSQTAFSVIPPGSYHPTGGQGVFTSFVGASPASFAGRLTAGSWTLDLHDYMTDDVGTLAGWSLDLYP